MSNPHIHGSWRSFSVSKALDQIGATITAIREEDNLTWKEVGRILGKSDDRAASYATGMSEMPIGAFLLACREWNGRFANATLAMIGMKLSPDHSDTSTDSDKLVRVLKLAHLIGSAIADDHTPGVIDDGELDGISTSDLEEAEHAIAALRSRKTRLARKALEAVA